MSLLLKLETDLNSALKAQDNFLVSTLKYLLSEIRNREIELRPTAKKLTDEEVIAVIRKEIKKRKEAAALFQKGGREDLREKEEREVGVLNKYLPQAISADELVQIVQEAIRQVGAQGPADFGKVMAVAMAKAQGRADGAQVAKLVKKELG